MRKTFELTHPRKTNANHVDTIKHEVKKYIARERRKKLPPGVDYWDFDCKIGENKESAKSIHLTKINPQISELSLAEKETFYLEIIAKHGHRTKK